MTSQLYKLAAVSALLSAYATSSFVLPDLAYASDAASGLKSTFAYGDKSRLWIDFEFYRNSQIFIPVKINGHAAVARLVIGAPTEIDAGLIESLGLQPAKAVRSDGAAVETIDAVEVEVGDLTVQGVSMRVKDLSTQAVKSGHPYSVLLSDEVLKEVVVDIDFPNHRLALRDPAATIKPAGAQSLPLSQVGVGYSVPLSVENAKPVLFHVEFGNSSPLMVTRPYAQSHSLLDRRHVSQRYTGPTKEPEDMVTLNNITFAGVNYLQMPTVVVPNSLFDPAWFDSDRLSGIVGLPLLARYRLLFDFTHNRLYALANAKATSQPFYKDRLGATLLDGQVSFVAPNSPAQLVGIKPGDKIALINGKPAAAWSNTEMLALQNAPVGTAVTFSMSSGQVHQLKLVEYY